MRADLTLKDKQAFWETPRNIAILLGAVAAVTGVVAGMAGYKYGSQTPPLMTPQPPPQIIFQPGSIVVQQAPVPAPTK